MRARARAAVLGGWLMAGLACGAQGMHPGMGPVGPQKPSGAIPATAPTTLQQAGAGAYPGQAGPVASGNAGAGASVAAVPVAVVHRAQVSYVGGLLGVRADNSSLNGILRDVARATGMKITGGVPEERVYGSYGPGEPGTVLATLLGGTGNNMVLINDARRAPRELVLTRRTGGVTPPNPLAASQAEEVDLPPQLTPRLTNAPTPGGPASQAMRERPPQPPKGFVPIDGAAPLSAPPMPASPGRQMTTEQSPNGVRTPQQIYDELLKLQQQPQKPPQ